jgi:hypothetical protein
LHTPDRLGLLFPLVEEEAGNGPSKKTTKEKTMKIKSQVKSGGRDANHNQTLRVKSAMKAGLVNNE